MNKKLLKTFLLVAGLLVGGSAWADTEYTTAFTQNYSGSDYASGWTFDGNDRGGAVQYTRTDITGETTAILVFHKGNNNGASETYSTLNTLDVYKNSTDWKVEFDAAFQGYYGTTASTSTASFVINTNGGKKVTFSISTVKNAGADYSGYILKNDGTTLGRFYQDNNSNTALSAVNATSNFTLTKVYHVVLTGNEDDGVNITITGDLKNASAAAATSLTYQLSEEFDRITTMVFNTGRTCGQQVMLDNLKVGINLETYKTRATAATTAYNAVKTKVMNPTQKSAIDAANTALAAFDTDEEIAANISGYVDAITDLETANANAENSANSFAVLNDLITNAAGVTGYDAPTGAESVFSANPASDVDVASLTASVRTAIVTAGTVNANTNITALIANSGFELGAMTGWSVTTKDTDSDVRVVKNEGSVYGTEGFGGTYFFNCYPNGNTLSQNIGTLAAGQYKLTAKASSTGATMYLIMNGAPNAGTVVNAVTTIEYTFTLPTATEVTIGINGGDNTTGNFLEDGGWWWYKCDDFTLTYVGQDELAQAKAALNDAIDAATTVKDTYTAKVGTAPFLYPVATYNTLVTELTEANTVKNSGSTTVKDYTDAKDELEAAKDAMSGSSQNAPDPDKYYRIFVANNDGTASDYNLNLLHETTKTQVKVTASPYPVKIVESSGRWHIQTPNGSLLCTDYTATTTAYTNGWVGSQARCGEIRITLNDNGSVKLEGYRGSSTYQTYRAGASEGAGVYCDTGTGTWVISDAVDVTDVTLAVNATAGWGTFIAPYDNLTPSTVKAYTVSYTQNNTVFFTENETGVLSANTPYILSTEETSDVSVAFKGIANNTENTYAVNGLVGLLTAGTVPVNSYVLQYQAEVDGTSFYKVTSAMTGTANRCYLDLTGVPTEAPSGARTAVSFRIFDETQGIEAIETAKAQDVQTYNLAGQRVKNAVKGLYIVNGKKVIIK